MKKTIIALLLTFIIGNIWALDTESSQFIDHLLSLRKPQAPLVLSDGVIFTAASKFRRVGIAFAHENYGKIYWFHKLMIPKDHITKKEAKSKNEIDRYRDSGILFFAYTVPQELIAKSHELDYRLIIDGLWTVDPLNPDYRINQISGISQSIVDISSMKDVPAEPEKTPEPEINGSIEGDNVTFNYRSAPGEAVYVAGSFNSWDPFMYQMREASPGNYSLSISLPPGHYQYVFFHGGERIPDPGNGNRLYSADDKAVSILVVP
jgi:hypothetical protein